MDIQLEPKQNHSILSYTDSSVSIKQKTYTHSLIVNENKIISDWPVYEVGDLNSENVQVLLDLAPEIILIGHCEASCPLPTPILKMMHQHKIGVELMPLGASCRTFNVLIAEGRHAALGLILKPDQNL